MRPTARVPTLFVALFSAAITGGGCSGDDGPALDAAAIDASVDASPDAPGSSVELISCAGVTPAATITTSGFAYDPVNTTITVGAIVKFDPLGNPHNMVSGSPGSPDGQFATPLSQVACLRFTAAGTFPFHCSVHLFTGTIVVN